jgi:Fe2+ or Zn2+ uptake regulation protein
MTRDQAQSEIHDLIRRRLSEHDHRYTGGRRTVVSAIQLANGLRTAAEIAVGSQTDVPISSMYRTLSVLDDAGVLRKQHDADGIARYELADWLTDHHHHVVCVSCGRIEDVALCEPQEAGIHTIAAYLGSQTGFRVLDHVLEVEGVCGACDRSAAALAS